jgi:hypothetical protein
MTDIFVDKYADMFNVVGHFVEQNGDSSNDSQIRSGYISRRNDQAINDTVNAAANQKVRDHGTILVRICRKQLIAVNSTMQMHSGVNVHTRYPGSSPKRRR